jgi:hypothetical protein
MHRSAAIRKQHVLDPGGGSRPSAACWTAFFSAIRCASSAARRCCSASRAVRSSLSRASRAARSSRSRASCAARCSASSASRICTRRAKCLSDSTWAHAGSYLLIVALHSLFILAILLLAEADGRSTLLSRHSQQLRETVALQKTSKTCSSTGLKRRAPGLGPRRQVLPPVVSVLRAEQSTQSHGPRSACDSGAAQAQQGKGILHSRASRSLHVTSCKSSPTHALSRDSSQRTRWSVVKVGRRRPEQRATLHKGGKLGVAKNVAAETRSILVVGSVQVDDEWTQGANRPLARLRSIMHALLLTDTMHRALTHIIAISDHKIRMVASVGRFNCGDEAVDSLLGREIEGSKERVERTECR